MSKLRPVGDVFMIEVSGDEENPLGLVGGEDPEDGVREGRVVDVGSDLMFFGYVTFLFDSSLVNHKVLKELYEHYKSFLGKRVCWPERSESGTLIEHEGKKYAFVKWTAISAVHEEEV